MSLLDRAIQQNDEREAQRAEQKGIELARLRSKLCWIANSKLGYESEDENRVTIQDVDITHKSGRHGMALIKNQGFLFLSEFFWDASGPGIDSSRLWVARHIGITETRDPKSHQDDWREIRVIADLAALFGGWKGFFRRRIPLTCRGNDLFSAENRHNTFWEIPIDHHWRSLPPCETCGAANETTIGLKSDPQIKNPQ